MDTKILTPASKARELTEEKNKYKYDYMLKDINNSILDRAAMGHSFLSYTLSMSLYEHDALEKVIHLLELNGYICSLHVGNSDDSAYKILIRW